MQRFSYIILSIFMIYIIGTHQADNHIQDIEECAVELGLTGAQQTEIYRNNVFSTRTEKCFMACIFKKIGRMEDGKFIRYAPNLAPNRLKKIQECADLANKQSDECEVASVAATCLISKHFT